jgi:hypothetical protein
MQEQEVPVLGINIPVVGINPNGVLADVAFFQLEQLGARKQYYDFDAMLNAACPEFGDVDWPNVHTRVLLGASEIIDGVETVFDSHRNRDPSGKLLDPTITHRWRARRELTLRGVASSGTHPSVREAEKIDGRFIGTVSTRRIRRSASFSLASRRTKLPMRSGSFALIRSSARTGPHRRLTRRFVIAKTN